MIEGCRRPLVSMLAVCNAGGGGERAGPRVCILGGGFGGLYTAVRLDQLLWPREMKPQVTLIDQSERFVFKPLLYDLLAGVAAPWEVAPAFAQLLAPYNINFVKGAVASVQPQETLLAGGSATGARDMCSHDLIHPNLHA